MESIQLPDYLFESPSTICIAGPSSSGKSNILLAILAERQKMFSQKVHNVVLFYGEYQEIYENPLGGAVTLHYGFPTDEELEQYFVSFEGQHSLIIFDDLMDKAAESPLGSDIATKLSHHRNVTCINLVQNIFKQGKAARTQAVNSLYIILTCTCCDLRQVSTLGQQLFPGKGSQFVQVYEDAVDSPLNKKYPGHLFIGCHPMKTKRDCRLLSNIFPIGSPKVLYRL